MAWKKMALEDNVITKAFMAAKGDLIGASGNDVPLILSVGTNGQVLTAASGEATGLSWSAAGSGDLKKDGSVAMEADFNFAGFEGTDFAAHNVADAAARGGLTEVLGKICFQIDETALYLCTAAA